MNAGNGVFFRSHAWEEPGVEKGVVEEEAVEEEQESRSSDGDLDSDFDEETEEGEAEEEGEEEDGIGDINDRDTNDHCTNGHGPNGYGTNDHGTDGCGADDNGTGPALNGHSTGNMSPAGISRKRGRSPSVPDLAGGRDVFSLRGHGFESNDLEDGGEGENGRAKEVKEEEDDENGISEDLEDDDGNRLADDANGIGFENNGPAFTDGRDDGDFVLDGSVRGTAGEEEEDDVFETTPNHVSSVYAHSLYASPLSANSVAQAPVNASASAAAADGLGFGLSANRPFGLRRFLEVAGAGEGDRGATGASSRVDADVAEGEGNVAECGADVERAGEAAVQAAEADVAAAESTTEGVLPDEVILEIIARVSDARARNCCALVSRRWRNSERLTRTSLSLRRSLADLLKLPLCFPNVRRLDLSLCPPCGQPLLLAGTALEVATVLRTAFPRVTSLRVHVRDRNDVQCVAATWPWLEDVALIRWHEFSAAEAAAAAAAGGGAVGGAAAAAGHNHHHHHNNDNHNRTNGTALNANPLGTLELTPLLVMCGKLRSLDLSEFTCFPDHVSDAFTAAPQAAAAIATAAAAAATAAATAAAAAAAAASANGAGGGAAAAAAPPGKPPRAPLPRPHAPFSALRHLNLLKSSPGAFKSSDIRAILAAAGRALLSFRCLTEFDPRLADSLTDETLIEIAERCPALTALQLVDSSLWAAPSGLALPLVDQDTLPPDMDARVTPGGVRSFLARLPGLEELDLRPAQYLRGADASLFGSAAGGGGVAGGGGGLGRGGVTAAVSLGQLTPNLKRLRLGQLVFAHNDSLGAVTASGEGTSGEGLSGKAPLAASLPSSTSSPPSSSLPSSSTLQPSSAASPPPTSTILPSGLEALDFWQAPSLPLRCLLPLALSCPRLKELSIWGCPDLTPPSLEAMARVCRHSLVRVTVVKCCNLPTAAVLKALSPVKSTLQHLHCSCDWLCPNRGVAPVSPIHTGANGTGDGGAGGGNGESAGEGMAGAGAGMVKQPGGRRLEGMAGTDSTEELLCDPEAEHASTAGESSSEWPALQSLTLLAPLGALLSPLPSAGLLHCPALSHIHIRAYGDCRLAAGPEAVGFGLSCLRSYPAVRSLRLDLTQVVGHSLSCPPGLAFDVMAWERFYLHGIQLLPGLESLHYWPPSDCDLNRRSMSMPSAGILGSCQSLRQLAVHCTTANEHLLNVVVRAARGMRDLHVLGDCYPAPPDDTYAGMLGPASFRRLIDVLDARGYPD
ncbi:hypothetical protein CLOM_g19676 [Closterium sp. NIES-68]|nr:hypothetical protein CLOM_g19676 [Closterium sp. NIES-68]